MNVSRINIDMCDCPCHNDDTIVLHCFPCCEYTYQKRSTFLKESNDDTRNTNAKPDDDTN